MSHLLEANDDKDRPTIDRGEGVFLYDKAGRDYLDGSSGAVVANIGHGVREIAAVAQEQIERIAYTYRTQFNNEHAERLADKLIQHAGDKAAAFFLNSGSEATEAALRLAIQYWREQGNTQKRRILSRRISYHGNTLGALSLSSDMRRAEMEDLLFTEPTVAPCYCYRCPYDALPDSCGERCAGDLEETIQRIGPESVAAFVVEPIVGATGGAIPPHKNYFTRVHDICSRYDVLLIVDEVITGLGRTGRWFAMHHWGISADITILGKGINGGFIPLSALLLSERVLQAIRGGSGEVSFGHTHSGTPISTAIGCEVIDYIEQYNLVENAARNGLTLDWHLHALAGEHELIGDVRGLGLLWGIEFAQDRRTGRPFPPQTNITRRVVDLAFQNGLIVYPCRGLTQSGCGDAILIAPPLTISSAQIGTLAKRLDEALRALANEL